MYYDLYNWYGIRLRGCILRRTNSEVVINLLSNRRWRLREPYLSYQLGTVVSVQDLLRSSLPHTLSHSLSLSVPRRTSPRVCVVGGAGGGLFEKGVSLGWWWRWSGGQGAHAPSTTPITLHPFIHRRHFEMRLEPWIDADMPTWVDCVSLYINVKIIRTCRRRCGVSDDNPPPHRTLGRVYKLVQSA